MAHIDIINELLTKEDHELDIFNKYFKNIDSKESKEFVYNLFTSFVDGSFQENSTHKFVCQCLYSFDIALITHKHSITRPILIQMIESWLNYLDETLDENENMVFKFNILIKIFKCIRELKTVNGQINLTSFMFSFKGFRDVLTIYKNFKNTIGDDFNGTYLEKCGLFCGITNICEYPKIDIIVNTSLISLINDNTCHNSLLDYINEIFKVNKYYKSNNAKLIYEKNCGSITFNVLLMKLLFKICEKYNFNDIVNDIIEKQYIIKEYDSKLPFSCKLYYLLLNVISICHVPQIYSYHTIINVTNPINDMSRIFSEGSVLSNKNKQLLKKMLKEHLSENNTNVFIQEIVKSFTKTYKLVNIEDIFSDVLSYMDYGSSFVKSDGVYYKNFDSEIYEFLSGIVGGLNGYLDNSHNSHNREYAFKIVLKISKSTGYDVFGVNFFGDIFNFISQVNIFKISNIPNALHLQKEIITLITMLLDLTTKLKDQPKEILAKTLFNLDCRALDICNYFKELSNSVSSNLTQIINVEQILINMLEIITMTLAFHSNVYDKKLIVGIFPEVEEKYIILISELIELTTNKIYKLLRETGDASNILNLIYTSIYRHINNSVEYLYKIKDIIISKIEFVTELSEVEKKFILDTLNNFKDTKLNIEYPDEFLDPITCFPIEDPIKIPNIALFFDKKNILTHVYEKSENPYTREKLTIGQLNEYNLQLEVCNEIEQFIKKKKEFEDKFTKQ